MQVVTELSRALMSAPRSPFGLPVGSLSRSARLALCAASDEATAIRDDVSFFQALQAALNKQSSTNRKTPEQIDAAIRQLVSKAITTEGQVIDVFTAAGLTPSPPAQSGLAQCCALSVSVAPLAPSAAQAGHQHSERPIPRRSARPQAQERRRRAAGEIAQGRTQGPLQAQPRAEPGVGSGIPMPAGFAHRFALPVSHAPAARLSEKLKKTLNAYHNRAISTMQVIEELIKLAKDLDAATKRGEDMGLTDDEIAFYDALAANDSAKTAMGDDKLKLISAELITQVKKSVTIDWTLRESARAKIKVMVKRILNKHGYPPDLQEEALKTVLAQAELLCAEWV